MHKDANRSQGGADLKVGIVGLGSVAGAHIEAFGQVRGATVTAVCSRKKLDKAALEQRYGLPLKVYDDYRRMLDDPDIDIVDICTPHPFHAEQGIAGARAGKHLLIEKPVALNYAELTALRDAIDKAKVAACVCFECRFSAHFTLVRSLLEQGLLGELHYGEVDYYHGIGPWYGQFDWNVKADFGKSSLLTAGCHALDALLWFMNDHVEEVVSYATRSASAIFAPYEYPTTTVTLLKFASGRVGKVASCIDCLQPYYFHLHLVGSEGSVLDNRLFSSKLKGMTKRRWSTLETSLIDSGDVHDHPYQAQFQAFIDSTALGQPMPLTNFGTAFETHRVVFAADRSAETKKPVRLSELVG
jgi:predicted dehydrogenase